MVEYTLYNSRPEPLRRKRGHQGNKRVRCGHMMEHKRIYTLVLASALTQGIIVQEINYSNHVSRHI